MRRFVIVLLCAGLVAGLAFGSGSGEATTPEDDVLQVLWWGGQARHDRTLEVVDMFEQETGITVEPEFLGWGGYWDRLSVMTAADEMPDVMQFVIERFPQYDDAGLLADISGIPEFDMDLVSAGALETGMVDGRLLGVVLGTNAYAMAYNPELFDEAGVEPPTPDWTWDDLVAASEVLYSELGVYGLNAYGADNDLEYWLRSNGYRLFAEDLSGPGWDDDEVIVEFYEQLLSFEENNVIPPYEYTLEYGSNEANSAYARGETAMMFLWSNLANSVQGTLGVDSPLTALPGPGQQSGHFLRPSMFFSIPSSSNNKGRAAEFLNFFLGSVDANRVLAADRGVPVVPEVLTVLGREGTQQNQYVFEYIDWVADNSSPIHAFVPDNEGELVDVFDQITQQVAFGQLTPAEGARQLHEQWSTLMAR